MSKTKEEEPKQTFLDMQKERMDILGFWTEEYKSSIIQGIECQYSKEVIRTNRITDIIVNGDKILLKWNKRHMPLTGEQLKEDYNM